MRHFNNLPRDDGSRRSPQCPPSHPSMASPSHPAQASAWTAQPSGPSTHVTSMGRVSPLLHQPGSMTYSPPTSATMGGEYCLTAVPPMLSAPAISSYRSTAPFSVVHAEISRKLDQIKATLARCTSNLARTLMEPLSHSPPLHIAGGARRRQHVICRRPKRVHQTAWQKGR